MVYQPQIVSLSSHFGISTDKFEELGVLDIPLTSDAPLFIDPQLLRKSHNPIFNDLAWKRYQGFYSGLLSNITTAIALPDGKLKDRALENIRAKLKSKEPKGLCLGYSKSNNRGRGIGKEISKTVLGSAIDIIGQGLNNPGIFSVLFLLEEGMGGDFISDLTANIIMEEILEFTQVSAKKLGIPTRSYLVDSVGSVYNLPAHPFDNTYLLLTPYDIVNRLPTESDLYSVFDTFFNGFSSASTNDEIRRRISQEIGQIWSDAHKDKAPMGELKRRLKRYVYCNPDAVNSVASAIDKTKASYIDVDNDPYGINIPSKLPNYLIGEESPVKSGMDNLAAIDALIAGFKHLMDNNTRIKRALLYDDNGNPRKEAAWQSMLQTYVDVSLRGLNIDITPEFETGRGPVDFKFSQGETFKVLVELKLSSNTQYKNGLEKQLEDYKAATTNVKKSYFIYIDLDSDADKSTYKRKILQNIKARYNLDSEIVFIDGVLAESASKAYARGVK